MAGWRDLPPHTTSPLMVAIAWHSGVMCGAWRTMASSFFSLGRVISSTGVPCSYDAFSSTAVLQ
jgi:hypothetical protein